MPGASRQCSAGALARVNVACNQKVKMPWLHGQSYLRCNFRTCTSRCHAAAGCDEAERIVGDVGIPIPGHVHPRRKELDIQVLHIERVVFDELAAGLYVLAHQGCEDGFAFGDIFELH
jgi:hypothetical protein